VIMPPTKGSSSSCAKVSNCMIAGDVSKAIRVLKESHLITDRRDTKVSSRRDLCEGCGETRIPTATLTLKLLDFLASGASYCLHGNTLLPGT
jgi:hypothetical protein